METDHNFLDKAAIESLSRCSYTNMIITVFNAIFMIRRLRVLNHCADLFVERITKYSKVFNSCVIM